MSCLAEYWCPLPGSDHADYVEVSVSLFSVSAWVTMIQEAGLPKHMSIDKYK